MKAARAFAVIFGVLGLILMLGTAGLCFVSLDAPVRVEVPEAAVQTAEDMLNAIADGDFTKASEYMYRRPDLGADRALTGEAAAVWEIFQSGISCELTSECYYSGTSLAIDAVITVPDIASITDSLNSHARELMNQRIAAATEMEELYDEENNFRQDLIDDVMAQAVECALAEEPETLTFEATLGIVYEGKQWWVVPDNGLMNALTGGLA